MATEKIIKEFWPGFDSKSKLGIASFEFAIYQKPTIFVEGELDKMVYKSKSNGKTGECRFINAGSKNNVIKLAILHKDTDLVFGIVDSDYEEMEYPLGVISTNRINLEAEILNLDNINIYKKESFFNLLVPLEKMMCAVYEGVASQRKKPNPTWREKDFRILLSLSNTQDLVDKDFFALKDDKTLKDVEDIYDENKIYSSKYIFALFYKNYVLEVDEKASEIVFWLKVYDNVEGINNVILKMNNVLEKSIIFNKEETKEQ